MLEVNTRKEWGYILYLRSDTLRFIFLLYIYLIPVFGYFLPGRVWEEVTAQLVVVLWEGGGPLRGKERLCFTKTVLGASIQLKRAYLRILIPELENGIVNWGGM